ncbi:TSUP family transporter [Paracoccus sphaerophysae]|uniref:TSUP family transporter n=1 Tax=Paracoccus sphaerophysae TaxID=690417 RepID=UPI001E3C140F|nr:TSUP family transporter [Paracoccus sphaerophysae]
MADHAGDLRRPAAERCLADRRRKRRQRHGAGDRAGAYSAYTLFARQLRVPAGAAQWLSPRIGGLTGLVTGATGVFVIPALPYLQALGLSRDDLVQALGLSFTASTVVLAVGLGAHGAFAGQTQGLSLAAPAPALVGMWAGQKTAQPDQSGALSACLSGVPAGAGRADGGAFPAVKKAGSGAVVFVLSPQPRAPASAGAARRCGAPRASGAGRLRAVA